MVGRPRRPCSPCPERWASPRTTFWPKPTATSGGCAATTGPRRAPEPGVGRDRRHALSRRPRDRPRARTPARHPDGGSPVIEEPTAIERCTFEALRLMDTFPPRWHHPNKEVVAGIASPLESNAFRLARVQPVGTVPPAARRGSQRCRGPAHRPARRTTTMSPSDTPSNGTSTLPTRSCSSRTARPSSRRTRCRSAEHPALGALVEALRAGGVTRPGRWRGTADAVLVRGVERRVQVVIDRNAGRGAPRRALRPSLRRGADRPMRRAVRRDRSADRHEPDRDGGPGGRRGRYSRPISSTS